MQKNILLYVHIPCCPARRPFPFPRSSRSLLFPEMHKQHPHKYLVMHPVTEMCYENTYHEFLSGENVA